MIYYRLRVGSAVEGVRLQLLGPEADEGQLAVGRVLAVGRAGLDGVERKVHRL